jgi:patatin-like phospholipase/acyl hydrolase
MPKKKKIETQEEERFILSIDGGGMRGLVPAQLIEELSHALKMKGDDKPFYAHFDLIAGTSTGGLIALALTAPTALSDLKKEEGEDVLVTYPIKELGWWDRLRGKKSQAVKDPVIIQRGSDPSVLPELYEKNGKKIFPQQSKRLFGQVLRDKYDERYITTFVDKIFQLCMMKDCLVPTMVVSYDVLNGEAYSFKSWDGQGYFTKEAARATSAAPTYFAPFDTVNRENGKRRNLIDGGMIANNPTLAAYKAARKLYPNCTKFSILSISTAQPTFKLETLDFGGVMGWIDPTKGAPLQKVYASSQMQIIDELMPSIPGVEYVRLDLFDNVDDRIKMDDTSPAAMEKLKEYAHQIYEKNEMSIDNYLSKLKQRDTFTQVRQPDLDVLENPEILKKRQEESDRLKKIEQMKRKEKEKSLNASQRSNSKEALSFKSADENEEKGRKEDTSAQVVSVLSSLSSIFSFKRNRQSTWVKSTDNKSLPSPPETRVGFPLQEKEGHREEEENQVLKQLDLLDEEDT